MNNQDLKRSAVSGMFYGFLDRAGSQIVGFLFSLILARILDPRDFGLVVMATIFFALSRVFVDGGLRDSLIQKKIVGPEDYNAVFFYNVILGILVYVIIYFSAPYIADFYNHEELTMLIRIIGICIPIHALTVVQYVIIYRNLKFRKLLKVRLPTIIISGVLGIILALRGLGVWALVVQQITEIFLFNLLLWVAADWRPSLKTDWQTFNFHWRFGSKLLVVDTINALYKNIFGLVIGKFFTAAQLGFFNRADTFRRFTLNNTVLLIQNISYPILTKVQDDNALLRRAYKKILQATSFIVLPIFMILISQSDNIIVILLTSKWLPAAKLLIILSIASLLSPFNTINLNILKVKRRADLLLKVQLSFKILVIVLVIAAIPLGFTYVIATNIVVAVFALFLNNYYLNKFIAYTLKEQILDCFPMILGFGLGVVIGFIGNYYLIGPASFVFLVSGCLSVIFYLSAIYLSDKKYIMELIGTFKLLYNRV